MGGEGDSNHLVSGGDLEGDSDFTQPRRVVTIGKIYITPPGRVPT